MGPFHNGITAENVAEKYNITRERLDEFALSSQEKAIIAIGHSVGTTGAILPVKLIYKMKRCSAKLNLAAMCIGGGRGISKIFENLAA